MNASDIVDAAWALVARGRGLLPIDESDLR